MNRGNRVNFDRELESRKLLNRSIEHLLRRACLLCLSSENIQLEWDTDYLGVRIGVVSKIRPPEQLLAAIHHNSFPTFEFPGFYCDDSGICWTHFRAC